MREAGIANYRYIDWFRDHPIDDDLRLYRWNTEKLGGLAHVPWRPFDHPQLGRIEIGGWASVSMPFEIRRRPRGWSASSRASPRGSSGRRCSRRSSNWSMPDRPTWAAAISGSCSSSRTRASCPRTCASAHSIARSCADWSRRSSCRGRRSCTASSAASSANSKGRAYKHTGISFWPDYHVTDDRMKLNGSCAASRASV